MSSFIRTIAQYISNVFTWWAIIAPWERGIRVRLGKHIKVLQPGVHLKVPILHKIYKQNTRLLIVDTAQQTLTTLDDKIVTMSSMLGYRIEEIDTLYLNVQDPEHVIINLVMGAASQYIVTHNSDECTPKAIEAAITTELSAISWGLKFSHVRIQDFAFVKTYKLMSNEGRNFYNSHDMDGAAERNDY